jgi:hypothetical protein
MFRSSCGGLDSLPFCGGKNKLRIILESVSGAAVVMPDGYMSPMRVLLGTCTSTMWEGRRTSDAFSDGAENFGGINVNLLGEVVDGSL